MKSIIFIVAFCVSSSLIAMNEASEKNVDPEAYTKSVVQKLSQKMKDLKEGSEWSEILTMKGQLKACIDLGIVDDQETLEELQKGMEVLDEAYHMSMKTNKKEYLVSFLQEAGKLWNEYRDSFGQEFEIKRKDTSN